MELNGSPQQLNSGSPMGTPTGTATGSRENSPIRGLLFEVSPMKRMSNFDSPSPKKGKGISLVQSPPDVISTQSTFQFNMGSPIPDISTRVSVRELLNSLADSHVISQISNSGRISPSTPVLGTGSFATVSSSPNSPKCVLKTYKLGANGKKSNSSSPKVDNTMLLRMLGALNSSKQIPECCAQVDSITISQNGDDWEMNIKQQKCSELSNDAKPLLECVVALLRKFVPKGQYPTDIKKSNFGFNEDGQAVWFDFDFKEVKKGKIPSLVSSGEFQFEGNEQFKQLLLVLLDFFIEIKEDRKEIFRELNQQKGLLQKYRLLSSDRSIYETEIDDFAEVLQKIELSEEDIAYLVGLLTPRSSQ